MPPWLDDFLYAYGSFIYGLGVNAILGLSMYAVLALTCQECQRGRLWDNGAILRA